MSRRLGKYALVAFLALGLAMSMGSSADARERPIKDIVVNCTGTNVTVTCSEVETNNGKTSTITINVAGPAAPGTGTGTPTGNQTGGEGAKSFDAALTANQTKVVNDGGFTVTTAANAGGTCGAITIVHGTQTYIGRTEEPVDDQGIAQLAGIQSTLAATDTLTEYAVTTINGAESSSGIVGNFTIGATCHTFGHVI